MALWVHYYYYYVNTLLPTLSAGINNVFCSFELSLWMSRFGNFRWTWVQFPSVPYLHSWPSGWRHRTHNPFSSRNITGSNPVECILSILILFFLRRLETSTCLIHSVMINVETKTVPKVNCKHEGNRTLDFQNRNLTLYPLSYTLLLFYLL